MQLDLSSDRFGFPSVIHAEFVAEMNAAFTRLEEGGEAHGDSDYLTGRLTEWYGRIRLMDIK